MNIYLIVFIVYFGIIIATSIMGSKKVESMEDFAVGGNKMGLLLGVGTSMATWLSVASVMGVPGNIYSRGVCAITGWIAGWFFATAVMPMVAYKIRRPAVPCRTFPELINLRYDPHNEKSPIRIFVAAVELVGYFVFSFIQIQGFGIVLSSITGISYNICCVAFMIILIFTCMGGFESVARTDTANAILILIGVIAGAVTVMHLTGGIGNIVENFVTTTAPAIEGQPALEAGVLGSSWGGFRCQCHYFNIPFKCIWFHRCTTLGCTFHGSEECKNSSAPDVLRTVAVNSCIWLSDHYRYGRQDDSSDVTGRCYNRLHVPSADYELP